MSSVAVLYINDEVVGPHLELLRNVCEPESRSRPHVTVRYFDRLPVTAEYRTTKVHEIDLIGPGAFGVRAKERGSTRTIFIRCKADDLTHLEHKPDYPASQFHVTVYDGQSATFAKGLLKELKSFKWNIRVSLPQDSTLSLIEISPRKSRMPPPTREYSPALKKLFYESTSKYLSWEYLTELSDEDRLKLTRSISKHLHLAVEDSRDPPPKRHKTPRRSPRKDAASRRARKRATSDEMEIHLTPPELATEMADYAVRLIEPANTKINFGDPAVGTGAFYSALLRVLGGRQRVSSAIGIDINAEQVASARWRWAHKGMKAQVGDYLHMERLPKRNLILANPPYLRHQKIRSKYKLELRDRAATTIGIPVSARSGLYVYFMLLSHAWMRPDAVGAWLIPSEFMQTNYGDAVRQYLSQKVELIRIHKFDYKDPQFENAMVLPAVVVFRNRIPPLGHTAQLSSGGTLKTPEISLEVRVEALRRQSRWAISERTTNTSKWSEIRVRDIFDIRRGIATGANDFFVMNRESATRLGIPQQALRPVLPKARMLKTDIVDRAPDGYPRVEPQLCLVDCDLSEEQIRIQFPSFADYLLRARDSGILNRNLVRNRHPWYKQERRRPAPFLCTYMGRGRPGTPPIRFIWNKSDAVATNTYLMLYPRTRLASLLKKRPGLTSKVFALLQETAKTTMSAIYRVHAGGLHKIEPGELLDVRFSSKPRWLADLIEVQLPLKVATG